MKDIANPAPKVLVVDDEEIVCDVARHALESGGFEVIAHTDGRSALNYFRQHDNDFACVVLDLFLPHLNGEDLYRELRQVKPDLPVVFSTGCSEADARSRFEFDQEVQFIRKPYRRAILVDAVQRAITEPTR